MSPVIRAPYPTVAAASTIYLKDTFTDTNGKLLTAHTMDVGSGWTVLTGSSQDIQNNRMRASSGNNSSMAAEAGQSNVEVSASFTPLGTSRNFGLLFRVVGSNSFWYLVCGNATTFELYDNSSGGFISKGTKSQATADGTPYVIKAVLNGTSIKCYLDSTLLFDVTGSGNQSATRYGWRTAFSGTHTIDDYIVKSL